MINYELSVTSYMPPLSISHWDVEREETDTELIKGVVLQLSESESYRIAS